MSRLEKPHVLLVDDNEATCTLITALLQRDFVVEVAADGQEAIERLRTRYYAALLLDLRMPVVDGFGVLEFIREQKPEMMRNVLVVTASLTHAEIDRAREYDVCGIVSKPFEVEALLAAVKRCAAHETSGFRPVLCSSGPMILLIADLLRQRLM